MQLKQFPVVANPKTSDKLSPFSLSKTPADLDNPSTTWTTVLNKKTKLNLNKMHSAGGCIKSKLAYLKKTGKCFSCFTKGHLRKYCKNLIRCMGCNKCGHILSSCPLLPCDNFKESQLSLTTPSFPQPALTADGATTSIQLPHQPLNTSPPHNPSSLTQATSELLFYYPDKPSSGTLEVLKVSPQHSSISSESASANNHRGQSYYHAPPHHRHLCPTLALETAISPYVGYLQSVNRLTFSLSQGGFMSFPMTPPTFFFSDRARLHVPLFTLYNSIPLDLHTSPFPENFPDLLFSNLASLLKITPSISELLSPLPLPS